MRVPAVIATGWLLPATLLGQTLEQRLAAVGSGTVHLSFAARPGVCGTGMHDISTRGDDDEWGEDPRALDLFEEILR